MVVTSMVLLLMVTLSVPLSTIPSPLGLYTNKSCKITFDAPFRLIDTNVSEAPLAPVKVIVFDALDPLTSDSATPLLNVPVWNSNVTAPPIPHVLRVLITLSSVAKSPVGPTE